jgi:hypothetical protein
MIKFWPEKMLFEFSTPEEAAAVAKLFAGDDKNSIQKTTGSLLGDAIASVLASSKTTPSPWTGSRFWEFLGSLGDSQKRILSELVRKRALRDEELRQLLGLEDNQQLAGVLSGISKQAGAHHIPARCVYGIQNETRAGEVTKTYVVAPDFLRIASEMNWPDR